jgi:protein-tyrosine phosphatase
MAKRILESLLGPDELGYFRVESAGTAATDGEPVSPDAEEIARSHGLSLAGFSARRLTPKMVSEADLILTMDRLQRQTILALSPESEGKVSTISAYAGGLQPDEGDPIPDPIGGGAELYADVYRILEGALAESLVRLMKRVSEVGE